MGNGMEYYYSKGPIWQYFDGFFSQTNLEVRVRNKLETLESLWRGPRFTEMGDRFPTEQYSEPAWKSYFHDLIQHANTDWFGLRLRRNSPPDASGSYDAQLPFTLLHLTTGFWKNWYGNSEEIVRTAYIRAIEVSLALAHPDAAAIAAATSAAVPAEGLISALYRDENNAPLELSQVREWRDAESPGGAANVTALNDKFRRNWPIEFWWGCGVPWFQAWVTWSQTRRSTSTAVANPNAGAVDEGGRVAVTWLTPTSAAFPIYTEMESDDAAPAAGNTRFGSWVIAHEDNDLVNTAPFPTLLGQQWPIGFPVNYSSGPILTVAPPWDEGGVAEPGPGVNADSHMPPIWPNLDY